MTDKKCGRGGEEDYNGRKLGVYQSGHVSVSCTA